MTQYRFVTPNRRGKWYDNLRDAQSFANAIGAGFLDAAGRFVAINFDRQRPGLVNEYKYDPRYSRSIGVDVRMILWLVGTYDGAADLVAEMLEA